MADLEVGSTRENCGRAFVRVVGTADGADVRIGKGEAKRIALKELTWKLTWYCESADGSESNEECSDNDKLFNAVVISRAPDGGEAPRRMYVTFLLVT